jgi:hypothetical protein
VHSDKRQIGFTGLAKPVSYRRAYALIFAR